MKSIYPGFERKIPSVVAEEMESGIWLRIRSRFQGLRPALFHADRIFFFVIVPPTNIPQSV